jgi:hypothetical protein
LGSSWDGPMAPASRVNPCPRTTAPATSRSLTSKTISST